MPLDAGSVLMLPRLPPDHSLVVFEGCYRTEVGAEDLLFVHVEDIPHISCSPADVGDRFLAYADLIPVLLDFVEGHGRKFTKGQFARRLTQGLIYRYADQSK